MIDEELKIKVKNYFQNKSLNGNAILIALRKNPVLKQELEQEFNKHKDLYQSIGKLVIIIIRDIQLANCIVCGKTLNYNATLNGRERKFCSNKCKLSKEGNPFAQKEIKERMRNNYLEKYGVDNPAKVKEVQEKMQQTCLERYGVINVYQSEEIKKKCRETFIKHYGESNGTFGISELREKAWITRKKNIYKRIIEKYKGKIEPAFTVEEYNGVGKRYKWKCLKCGNVFESVYDDGYIKSRCFNCYPRINTYVSSYEKEIAEFITSYGFEIDTSNRTLIFPLELDIVIPDKKLAIEFNGIYWHSTEIHKDPNYHLNKTLLCKEKGYRLIHIWEFDWTNPDRQIIVKNILKEALEVDQVNIDLKDCSLIEVSKIDKDIFLNENFIYGSSKSDINLGLIYNDELVSLMAFKELKDNKWKIEGYCSSINIKNGYMCILEYFKERFKPLLLEVSVDRNYYLEDLYLQLGFEIKKIKDPKKIVTNGEITYFNSRLEEKEGYFTLYDIGSIILESR